MHFSHWKASAQWKGIALQAMFIWAATVSTTTGHSYCPDESFSLRPLLPPAPGKPNQMVTLGLPKALWRWNLLPVA